MQCPFDEAEDELLFTLRHDTLRIHWCGHFCLFIKTAGVAESDTHKVCRLTHDPAPHYSALEHAKMWVRLGTWFSKHLTGQTAAGVETVFLGI